MFVSRVSTSLLFERINAESNSPEMLTAEQIINSSLLTVRPLGDLVIAPINNSIRNVSEEYGVEDADVPLFRPADMRSLFLDTAGALRVTREFEQNHRKARVHPGNILISAAGTVASVARVPSNIEFGCINGSFARVVVKKECEGFVLSYLASRYGFQAMMRWAVGSVQKHLNLEDLPNVKIAMPNLSVQKYIGDKVHQAERLRFLGLTLDRAIEKDIESLFSEVVRDAIKYDSKDLKHNRVTRSLLNDRLDSRYYSASYVRLNLELRDHPSLAELTSKIECGPFGGNAIADDLYEADGLPFIRPLNLTGSRFDQSKVVSVSSKRLKQFGLKEYDGENLYFARVGSPAVAYFSGPASISPNVIIARGKSNTADVAYLQCFCSSVFGLMQLEQELKEGVQPTTSTDAIRNLKVVLPSPGKQQEIGDRYRTSEVTRQTSERLVVAAKQLVEALIERKVSEDELNHAQNRLEQGDDSVDRAILGRIFEGGLDARDTRPLFPNLDAYYETLRMVEREQNEVAAK